jgi:hypothetical protein
MDAVVFDLGRFGDRRRERAGAALHQALAENPGSCIRQLGGTRAREMRFHRFLRNKRVGVEEMALTVGTRTAERAAGRDVVVIQDTSEVVIGGLEARRAGFGPVGGGGATGGVLVHAAIVVDAREGALLGALDVKVWNREGGEKQTKRGRALIEKESYRWLEVTETAARLLGGARSVTMVSDAESDMYELFAGRPSDVHLLIRATRERCLLEGGTLTAKLAAEPPAARIVRTIPAAPGRPERAATLALRFMPVEITAPPALPKSVPRSCALHAVEVREEIAPAQGKPIHWLLLTTHEVTSAARAEEILDLYRSRWTIELVFRTLKSAGFRIEDIELLDPKAVVTFAAAATIASVTIMQLVKARDGDSARALEDCFETTDRPLIEALSARLEGATSRQKNPHPKGSLAFASWVMARLGGWTIYYGKPGAAVMRHGLDRFYSIRLGTQVGRDL